MYYVYVLKSLKDLKNYIGLTTNISKRLIEHNQGNVSSTKSRRPFELIYFEEYDSKILAERREKYFKSGRGYEVLRNLLKKPPPLNLWGAEPTNAVVVGFPTVML